MPGIVKQHQDMSTPKRGEKRPSVKQTPTPNSRLKKVYFELPPDVHLNQRVSLHKIPRQKPVRQKWIGQRKQNRHEKILMLR